MSKKSRFRGCFEKEYGTHAEALLKSESQILDHIYLSLGTKLCSKKSLLLTCEIFGLLINTLATDEKYLFVKGDNITMQIQKQLSQKQKIFFNFWLHFWNLDWILNILKKNMTLTDFVFPNYRTLKKRLDKCLKSPVSEHRSASNMVNVAKHCWNLYHRPFIIFIDHCQEIELKKVSLIDMQNLGTAC